MVAFYVSKYLLNNNFNEQLKYAYESGNTIGTALVRVGDDSVVPINQAQPVLFVFIDPFAAFDTVDHNVLLSRLKDIFGESGKVLECFRPYLEHSCQRVSVRGI